MIEHLTNAEIERMDSPRIENFKNIKPKESLSPAEALSFWDNLFMGHEGDNRTGSVENPHGEPSEQPMDENRGEHPARSNPENLKECETTEPTREVLTAAEKNEIKKETGWSEEIIDGIKNRQQYEILKKADLMEAEINGRKCLIRKNIDLNYTDEDGISNQDRISRGLAPLDSKTGKPLELHHLGQKADSPLVELTEEEHRTGDYEGGKKNQSLWHDNTVDTEVHGEGNTWLQERIAHWKDRAESLRGEQNG